MSICPDEILLETNLPLPLIARGKVRDIYDLGDNLLFVATDRISAFDCILGSGIPCKGRVLTQMSAFWLDHFKDLVASHLLSLDATKYSKSLAGRAMVVKKAQMIPVECVARGYLAGSGWKEYQEQGTVCGIQLPHGLRQGNKLPAPIFTPATKAQSGHDENVSFEFIAAEIGADLASRLRNLTLEIYNRSAGYALERGIIVADTKFEFGFVGSDLTLADEVLTPDSSRYWPADRHSPGEPQFSFDKQFVRDYLETLDWNKKPPAPVLPDDVVLKTSEKYREAFERITGRALIDS